MTQENLLKLAKQGNPKALAVMLNQSLQPKGIAAKVSRKDDCLQILLESAQIPDQKAMVSYIRNGLIKLEVESIKTVKVYGRQTGEESSAWSKKFEIGSQQEMPSSTEETNVENFSSVVRIVMSIIQAVLTALFPANSPILAFVYLLGILPLILASNALLIPFWQGIKAIIYCDLRSRREGLGLEIGDSR